MNAVGVDIWTRRSVVPEKDPSDLSLLDEIRQSGFIDQIYRR